MERAFERAKEEHAAEQALRAGAHEEAYRAAVEKREGRITLLKVRVLVWVCARNYKGRGGGGCVWSDLVLAIGQEPPSHSRMQCTPHYTPQ